MSQRSNWVLISCWSVAASICTFVLWVPLAALAGSFASEIGVASVPGSMLAYVFYLPVLAPLIILGTAPAYAVLFWFWGRLCRRHPRVDTRWRAIATFALAAGVLPAIGVAVWWAYVPPRVGFGQLVAWAPCCLVMFWGAIVAPRWLFDALHPGAFSQTSGEVPAA